MNWWEYQKLINSGPSMTGTDYRILVRKESIPIVFVPGIMGSRLQRQGQPVWDPNSTGKMLRLYYNADPAKREELLNDNNLAVADDTSSDFQSQVKSETLGGTMGMYGLSQTSVSDRVEQYKAADQRANDAVQQGWGTVAWDFYGKILQFLASADWSPFTKCFVFPVYAVGYNWVQDNLKSGAYLASKLTAIKKRETAKGLICEKLILVSHSMGGLVTRSCVVLNGGGGDVLGVIHGAQPVLGAPVAYRRMRAGFEASWSPLDKISSRVLGPDSATVVPVLGNSVAGLELLPTSLYRTNGGQTDWLSMTKNGSILHSKPGGDPYASIYENSNDFLRLIYHQEYLDPAGIVSNSKSLNARQRE